MKIAVVDDLKEDRDNLTAILKTYFQSRSIELNITEFSSAEQFLAAFETDLFDLCFMDIFMDKINGMQAARKLYQIDSSCIIIFLTTSTDYIADGYDVRAWRYLLKPITEETVRKILPDCIDKILQKERRLYVSINRIETELSFSKIYYIQTLNRKIEIVLADMRIPLSSHVTFNSMVKPLLSDYRFLFCGKGLIVNMAHIGQLTEDRFIMKNNDEIMISRRELPDVRKKFLDYFFSN